MKLDGAGGWRVGQASTESLECDQLPGLVVTPGGEGGRCGHRAPWGLGCRGQVLAADAQ